MNEEAIYTSEGVEITKRLVKIGNASYAVANIGSVSVEKDKPTATIMCGFVAFIFALGALINIFSGNVPVSEAGTFAMILLVSSVVVFVCVRGVNQPSYHLIFRTSSSENRVLVSRDLDRLQKIQSAIEDAIVSDR